MLLEMDTSTAVPRRVHYSVWSRKIWRLWRGLKFIILVFRSFLLIKLDSKLLTLFARTLSYSPNFYMNFQHFSPLCFLSSKNWEHIWQLNYDVHGFMCPLNLGSHQMHMYGCTIIHRMRLIPGSQLILFICIS